jgi:hypothetical protein
MNVSPFSVNARAVRLTASCSSKRLRGNRCSCLTTAVVAQQVGHVAGFLDLALVAEVVEDVRGVLARLVDCRVAALVLDRDVVYPRCWLSDALYPRGRRSPPTPPADRRANTNCHPRHHSCPAAPAWKGTLSCADLVLVEPDQGSTGRFVLGTVLCGPCPGRTRPGQCRAKAQGALSSALSCADLVLVGQDQGSTGPKHRAGAEYLFARKDTPGAACSRPCTEYRTQCGAGPAKFCSV